jgi:hypothetical protein
VKVRTHEVLASPGCLEWGHVVQAGHGVLPLGVSSEHNVVPAGVGARRRLGDPSRVFRLSRGNFGFHAKL